MKRFVVGLVVLLLALAGVWSTVREREIHLRVTGHVAALPAPAPGQEPDPVEVTVWFPELRLLVGADGVHSYREGASLARLLPGRIVPGLRFQAAVQPDGKYLVDVTLRSRQVPTHCTLAFSRPGFVTKRLRQVPVPGTRDDLTPWHPRSDTSRD